MDPVGLQGASACFFPYIIGLPQVPPMGRLPRIAPQRDFVRRVFRDRRYSLRSGLLVCSPPRSPLPLRLKGRRAAVTFHPSKSRIVTVACIGYASRLNQATDGGRLSPPTLAALSAATRDFHSLDHQFSFTALSRRTNISIALIVTQKSEQKAHACA